MNICSVCNGKGSTRLFGDGATVTCSHCNGFGGHTDSELALINYYKLIQNSLRSEIEKLRASIKTARRDAINDAIKATMVKIEGVHALTHRTRDLEAFADAQLKE